MALAGTALWRGVVIIIRAQSCRAWINELIRIILFMIGSMALNFEPADCGEERASLPFASFSF